MKTPAGFALVVAFILADVAVSPARADEQTTPSPPNLEEIVLVFKTHFDIGFTDMAAAVVQRYRTSMIDNALAVVDDSASEPEELKFVWTIPGWPMSKILEDWPGQTPERKRRVMEAFRQGRFVVHGLPFTTHTETLSEEDLVRGMRFSTELSRAAGLELPRDAKMTDVPCHSWILPTLLKHAGIKFLHIGSNSGCSDPRVPLLFFREGPDGSRVLTMHVNGYGTGLAPPPDWPYKTWLGLIHTGDNHGPPRPEEVRRLVKEAKTKYPGVKVRIGRLSDFADAILTKEDMARIPVVRGDTPDTWIHGPMCDPQGRIAARHVQAALPAAESLAMMLDAWGIGADNAATAAPRIAEAYEQSLLYGEHTWGASFGWIGRRLDYDQGWQQRLDERHRRMVASWDEHSAYAHRAQAIADALLDGELQRLSQSIDSNRYRAAIYNPLPWERDGLAIVDGQPQFVRDVPPMGYRTLYSEDLEGPAGIFLPDDQRNGKGVVENDFFRMTYDRKAGRVTSLVDKKNKRELVRADSDGLGHFLYERFSAEQCDRFVHDYNTSFPKWVSTAFSKPDLPRDVPYRAQSSAAPAEINEISTGDGRGVRFVFSKDPSLPCSRLELEFLLYDAMPVFDITLSFDGKRADTWPEAGWLCLPLAIERPQFRLGRLGGIVDPARDIIPGANRHLLWLNHGMAVFGEDGYGVGICPIDAPAVSLGEPGCWRFSWDYVPRKADVFVNLFNNQWTTNFRLWNEGSWRQRVRIWTFNKYDAQESLIRPALEARHPMIGKTVHGRSDVVHSVDSPMNRVTTNKLPERATGLAISRRGVAVTSFGVDPDTGKRMLRLWEQAGRDGPCTITLPEGLGVRRIRPCDLRGRPAGAPTPVKDGRFDVEIGHFTPLNLELISD